MLKARTRNRRRKLATPARLALVLTAIICLSLLVVFQKVSTVPIDTSAAKGQTGGHYRRHLWSAERNIVIIQPGPARREELVVALPSSDRHLTLIEASSYWRQGLRTLIAINNTAVADQMGKEGRSRNETWVVYPDDNPLRANYPGDTRAAIVPFLAHKVLGSNYKWLLYGDDDTQWFIDGVLDLVKDLDYKMPYFITDNMWWSSINNTIGYQPNLEAPRCLPCNYSAYGRKPLGEMTFNAPEGCPCTPQLLCAADRRQVFDAECNIPLHPVRTFSMHGGAGGILSLGLLQAVSLKQIEDCIRDLGHSTGGDAFISICLWKLGYAHTDPGPWFNQPEMRLFDAAAGGSMDLLLLLSKGASGLCSRDCEELLDHMVSSHVHSRKAGSMQNAADLITILSTLYDAYMSKCHSRTSAITI